MKYIKLFENETSKFSTDHYSVVIHITQIHFYIENNIIAFWLPIEYTSKFINFLESDHKKFIIRDYKIERIDNGFNIYDHNGRNMRCFLNKKTIPDLIEFLETYQNMKKYNL